MDTTSAKSARTRGTFESISRHDGIRQIQVRLPCRCSPNKREEVVGFSLVLCKFCTGAK
jgi:hypothetical protein